MGVIESLPPDLLLEINDLYGGMLISLMAKHKGESADIGSLCGKSADIGGLWPTSFGSGGGVTCEEKVTLLTSLAPLRQCTVDNREQCHIERPSKRHFNGFQNREFDVYVLQGGGAPGWGWGRNNEPHVNSVQDGYMCHPPPRKVRGCQLTQPGAEAEETSNRDFNAENSLLKSSVHEKSIVERVQSASVSGAGTSNMTSSFPEHGSRDSVSHNELLIGNPPRWVDNFKLSNCLISNIFADMYYKSGSTGQLSSILQQTMSDFRFPLGSNTDGLDDAIHCLSELLKQYIKLKIETDIEEIYLCFRLLRRLSTKSTFFLEVYNVVLPDIQIINRYSLLEYVMLVWDSWVLKIHPQVTTSMCWILNNIAISKGNEVGLDIL